MERCIELLAVFILKNANIAGHLSTWQSALGNTKKRHMKPNLGYCRAHGTITQDTSKTQTSAERSAAEHDLSEGCSENNVNIAEWKEKIDVRLSKNDLACLFNSRKTFPYSSGNAALLHPSCSWPHSSAACVWYSVCALSALMWSSIARSESTVAANEHDSLAMSSLCFASSVGGRVGEASMVTGNDICVVKTQICAFLWSLSPFFFTLPFGAASQETLLRRTEWKRREEEKKHWKWMRHSKH